MCLRPILLASDPLGSASSDWSPRLGPPGIEILGSDPLRSDPLRSDPSPAPILAIWSVPRPLWSSAALSLDRSGACSAPHALTLAGSVLSGVRPTSAFGRSVCSVLGHHGTRLRSAASALSHPQRSLPLWTRPFWRLVALVALALGHSYICRHACCCACHCACFCACCCAY